VCVCVCVCVCGAAAETDGATDMWKKPDFEHMKSRQYHRCIGQEATAILFSTSIQWHH